MFTTPYGLISDENHQRATQIKLLICDVDGVFSDGRIYMGDQGEELKAFHTKGFDSNNYQEQINEIDV